MSGSVIVNVQTISWMKKLEASNSDHAIYFIGEVTNIKDTLLVADDKTKVNMFYCKKHRYVYGLRDRCAECITAALDDGLGVGVTARNAP